MGGAKKTGALSATGYVLSHAPMIAHLTEAEFLLGEYETYQVPLALIERETKLDFGDLKAADPVAATADEAAFGTNVIPIHGASDIRL